LRYLASLIDTRFHTFDLVLELCTILGCCNYFVRYLTILLFHRFNLLRQALLLHFNLGQVLIGQVKHLLVLRLLAHDVLLELDLDLLDLGLIVRLVSFGLLLQLHALLHLLFKLRDEADVLILQGLAPVLRRLKL